MSRTPLTLAALFTGVLAVGVLTTACQKAETSPAVRPVNISLVSYGGADPPSGEYNDLAVSCIDDLRNGRDADCESRAEAASASSDSQVAALARVLDTVAEVNQGKIRLTPQQGQQLQKDSKLLPGPVQAAASELGYRTEAVSFAANGDQKAADAAMNKAQRAAPKGRSAEIAGERCRAAPTAPSCTGGTPVPTTTGPSRSGEPTTSKQDATGGKDDGQTGQGGGGATEKDEDGNQGNGQTGGRQDARPG